MPSSRSTPYTARFAFPRPLLIGFVLAALTTLLIAFVNVQASDARADAVDGINRASQSMRHLSLLNASLKDAEIGQRGYLLTGDERYLEPYRRALGLMDQRLADLKASASENPAQVELLREIETIARQKLAELSQTVDLRMTGQADAAMTIVRTDTGKDAMDRLRDLIGDLYTQQSELLDTRRQAWEDAAVASAYYSWAGSAFLLVLIFASAGMTAREYRLKAEQAWVNTGLSAVSMKLQGDHRIEEIGERALESLATYLRAEVGAGYLVDERDGSLRLFGGYALPGERLAQTLLPGEGLAGQAVRSRQLIHVKDVPPGHLQLASIIGKSDPLELVLVPAVLNRRVYAVLELGLNHRLNDAERNLLERASETLAVAVRAGIDRSRLEALLEETQRQSEELQTQQEELRVSNEELEQQSRMLQESQARMEVQQTELEQTNVHLEEQTKHLEHQREQLLRAQGVLTEQARELELASRYKSEFLANMSHELRTPLNSTLILAKLLAENKPGNLSTDQVKYAHTIYAAGTDLLALINDILDLAKIEAGQVQVDPEPVQVAPMLQGLLDPLRPLAQQKGLALELVVDPDVPARMQTDPMRLGQILKNLLSNALKFTDRGSVSLRVSRTGADSLAFAVKDTGIGIPEEQQALIFEAFRQADGSTHRKFGGTGLGLSIARDLAQLLGGTVSVGSTPGAGSVFTLVLPVHLQAAARPAAQAATPSHGAAPA
ncbi:CHASE3 domain-containing protein, partial [Bordetella petrii]|uniref:CHASE3 domain-containing protein n=1 Tax=Bordetella petrii TaxID=94624 RepID=UPI001E52AEBF